MPATLVLPAHHRHAGEPAPHPTVLALAAIYAGHVQWADHAGADAHTVTVEEHRYRTVTATRADDGTWVVDQVAHHPATRDGEPPRYEAPDLPGVLDRLDYLRVTPAPAIDPDEHRDRAHLTALRATRALDGL